MVLALDFRLAPKAPYPASVADVNFGTRWLKANAAKFGSRPDWVGTVAGSSGGHQALLSALKPHDPRYAAATSPELKDVDASVAYFVACWPISDPLARYRMAVEKNNERLTQAHKDYFGGEAAMTEGNPQLILERGENGKLPPILILQGTKDNNVTPDMAEKFSAAGAGEAGLRLRDVPGPAAYLCHAEPDRAGIGSRDRTDQGLRIETWALIILSGTAAVTEPRILEPARAALFA